MPTRSRSRTSEGRSTRTSTSSATANAGRSAATSSRRLAARLASESCGNRSSRSWETYRDLEAEARCDSELDARPCCGPVDVEVPVRIVVELVEAPPAIAAVDREVAHHVQLDADLRVVDRLPVFVEVGEVCGVLRVDVEEGDRPD